MYHFARSTNSFYVDCFINLRDSAVNIISRLESIVGRKNVSIEQADLEDFGLDRTSVYCSNPRVIVFPTSIDQIQEVIYLANDLEVPIVPSGGRTGLSGGAVASNSEIVLSMNKMNSILDVNLNDRTVTVEAGATTQEVQEEAYKNGLFYPVNFASVGSSQIGGNVATNAGGVNVIKYGMTRDWVSGITAVTGSGELLVLNKSLIKNNTGYDFRHLFIGSEGTLGIICQVTLKLTEPPPPSSVFILGVSKFKDLLEVLKIFQSKLSLQAFEFFCDHALEKVIEVHGHSKPFETYVPFYALIDFENQDNTSQDEALKLYSECVDKKLVLDGVMSESIAQSRNMWKLREDISETLWHYQPYKNDLSVRISKMPNFLDEIDSFIKKSYPNFEVIWYGHIGDGNLHLNILKPDELNKSEFKSRCDDISINLGQLVESFDGSISAEHGVGLLKRNYLKFSKSSGEINLMAEVKKVFDPKGILNPGKLL